MGSNHSFFMIFLFASAILCAMESDIFAGAGLCCAAGLDGSDESSFAMASFFGDGAAGLGAALPAGGWSGLPCGVRALAGGGALPWKGLGGAALGVGAGGGGFAWEFLGAAGGIFICGAFAAFACGPFAAGDFGAGGFA